MARWRPRVAVYTLNIATTPPGGDLEYVRHTHTEPSTSPDRHVSYRGRPCPRGTGTDKEDTRAFVFPIRPGRREHVIATTKPDQKAQEATGRYVRTECPRHLWPHFQDALKRSKASFTTGVCNGSVEVLVAERGVAVAERFGLAVGGRASDPWPAKLKANEARDKFRKAAGPDPTDPFEIAFRRYAAEARARKTETP